MCGLKKKEATTVSITFKTLMLAPILKQLNLNETKLGTSSELGRWNRAEKQTQNSILKLKWTPKLNYEHNI